MPFVVVVVIDLTRRRDEAGRQRGTTDTTSLKGAQMTPYCGYAIYDVERTKSSVEQLEIDAHAGRLAAALTQLWRSLTGPVRALRLTPERPSRLNVEQRLDLTPRDGGGMPTVAGQSRAPR
jgi:hypothetical protein